MTLYIYWDVSPEILAWGKVAIRWYGLLFATGFFIGYSIMQRIYKREGKPLTHLDSLLWYVLIGTIVGARLGHCFFYEPKYYLENPIEIIKVWEGGLASHGGTLGVLIGLWLYAWRHPSEPFWWLADRLTIPTALTAALIRIGNLFNSEIYGKVTNLPWGFIFVRAGEVEPRHPTQIYEALAYGSLFLVLWRLYHRKPHFWAQTRRPLGLFMVWVFGWRFLIEFIKEVQVSFETQWPLDLGQLLSIPFILWGAYLWLKNSSSEGQKFA